MTLNQQREALNQRIVMDRRKAITSYVRTILDGRSGIDRRASSQLIKDNQLVNNWMASFDQLRRINQ